MNFVHPKNMEFCSHCAVRQTSGTCLTYAGQPIVKVNMRARKKVMERTEIESFRWQDCGMLGQAGWYRTARHCMSCTKRPEVFGNGAALRALGQTCRHGRESAARNTYITRAADGRNEKSLHRCKLLISLNSLGWLMGLEPTTTGITILDSTN